MKNFDHISCIHKSLSGQISVVEQQELEQWLAADPSHKAISNEVALIWRATAAYKKDQVTDVEAALSRFKETKALEVIEPIMAKVPTNIKSLPVRRYFLRIAAAAAVLFFGLFFLLPEMGLIGNSDFAVIETPSDQTKQAALGDGTTVYVNESTVFEYPEKFEVHSRKVVLKGEAFFEVKRDVSKPFSVTTSQLEVKVLGTSFNIYAYPNKFTEEVTVATGKVAVSIKNTDEEFILEAGDHLSFNQITSKVVITRDAKQNAQAWRTGILTFDDTSFGQVCQTLEKHFDISIGIKNAALLDCTVTVPSFKNAKRDVVLETLKTVFSMELKQTGEGSFEFSGGTCE